MSVRDIEVYNTKVGSKTKNSFFLLKLIFYFAIFYICNYIKLINIFPCFFGIYLSLYFFEKNKFCCVASFIGVNFILGKSSFQDILFLGIVVVSAFFLDKFFDFIFKKIQAFKAEKNFLIFNRSYGKKKKIKFELKNRLLWKIGFCWVIDSFFYLIFNLQDLTSFYLSFLSCIFNLVSSLCLARTLTILKERNFKFNFVTDEIVYLLFLNCLMFCGLQNVNYFVFDIVKFFGIALIISLTIFSDSPLSIFVAISSGVGSFLLNGDLSCLAYFCVISVVCYLFKDLSKNALICGVLLGDIFLNLFFKLSFLPIFYLVIPTAVVCLIFLIIPNRIFCKIKEIFFCEKSEINENGILNQQKDLISKRLAYTSEVFFEMDKNLRSLIGNNIDTRTAKKMICNSVTKDCCENCKNKNRCLKASGEEYKKTFVDLTNLAFEKGKISLLDLPPFLTGLCPKVNLIVKDFNSYLLEYKKFSTSNKDCDGSKFLIAEQLSGLSQILKSLSDEAKIKLKNNLEISKMLKENLIYNNIFPTKLECFEQNGVVKYINIVFNNSDFDNDLIEKILTKSLKYKMVRSEIFTANEHDKFCANYRIASTYNLSFGVAQTTKGGENICGDSHSLIKLNDDKFLLAICDGMGHGEKANRTSEMSISLIENYYKAGFDNKTILNSVNSLLGIGGQDDFSALDISVIDLKSGETDFIKQGATFGFVKNKNSITKIESNSLPIGVLEGVEPKITKTVLSPEDTMIMISDGVIDAFSSEEIFENYLFSLPNKSSQELAQIILNKARQIEQNYPKDDMTVIVGKLYYNCG